MAGNFHIFVANSYFVIRHLWLPVMDLKILLMTEAIRKSMKLLENYENP